MVNNKKIIVTIVGLIVASLLNMFFNEDKDLLLMISVAVATGGFMAAIWIWLVNWKTSQTRRK